MERNLAACRLSNAVVRRADVSPTFVTIHVLDYVIRWNELFLACEWCERWD